LGAKLYNRQNEAESPKEIISQRVEEVGPNQIEVDIGMSFMGHVEKNSKSKEEASSGVGKPE